MKSWSWTAKTTTCNGPQPSGWRKERKMVIGLIVGIVFIAGVLYFQNRNKDE